MSNHIDAISKAIEIAEAALDEMQKCDDPDEFIRIALAALDKTTKLQDLAVKGTGMA